MLRLPHRTLALLASWMCTSAAEVYVPTWCDLHVSVRRALHMCVRFVSWSEPQRAAEGVWGRPVWSLHMR
eukprot:792748-Prymnesium_polylepis.1